MHEHDPSKQKRNGHAFPGLQEGSQTKAFQPEPEIEGMQELTEEIDHQILMHRDAHFGGDFAVMLEYYSNLNHIGVQPDIDLERIVYLDQVEKELGQDLAPMMLSGSEAEAIARCRSAYAKFKEIYEIEEQVNDFPRLIADLVLSEDEEPTEEIEKIVAQGTAIVPDLISLLNTDELYDALSPGYGYAPYLAALCLGKIGDERAIIPLFETLSKQCIFDEMAIVEALREIGDPAKEFLLKTIQSRPLTHDNANAAFALIVFADDTRVATACFEQLKDPSVRDKPLLSIYLLCCCELLNETPHREAFIQMANDPQIAADLRSEMQQIIKEWD